MAALNDLAPFNRIYGRGGRDYQNVPLGDVNADQDSRHPSAAGLGFFNIDYEHSTRRPVSPRSPESARHFSQSTTQQNTPGLSAGFPSPDWVSSHRTSYNGTQGSQYSLLSPDRHQHVDCPTSGDILVKPWSGITIFVLFLSVYTFCFSGVFLGIALAKPRWGRRIGADGLSYSTATLLSALFSKTVELSFVAVLVATIGQILSRRAIAKKPINRTGISIAEMTMRSWILQPGLIFTHGSALKYAGPTLIGALVLVATFAATFYTTAAEALTSPKLKFGPWEKRVMYGMVDTVFANATFLTEACETPIQGDADAGGTCLQIDYAGQAYHNFQSYLANWTAARDAGDSDSRVEIHSRPKPVSLVWDNTTCVGQWITPSGENVTNDSANGRLVQNVTVAMPHANLIRAARHPDNKIAQPEELAGQGEYYVIGSIPAPAINVLCVGLSTEEVEPLIYDPNNTVPHSASSTVVDDIFGFGDFFNDGAAPAPLFPHLPIVYNTVNNNSLEWGPAAVYLLGTPPDDLNTSDHILCSIKVMQYPHCTTKYHAAESGGELTVHCDDDPENTRPYSETIRDAPSGIWDSNWEDIGSEWLKANALSHGISDGNASIARIITQMTPRHNGDQTVLNPDLPSIGEALAVLAGSTAIMSSFHAPFNHTDRPAGPPSQETFPASVRYKDYASGGSEDWQGIFYVILFVVFLINLFALVYLFIHLCTDGQVTDYTEPQNLFALAVMSPPSQSLSGSCGAGPTGTAYGKRWRVDMQSSGMSHTAQHPHFYMRCTEDVRDEGEGTGTDYMQTSTNVRRHWKRKSRVKSMHDMDGNSGAMSPAIEQYRRLAG